ncbi:MAG: hypothetical protein R3Y26_08945 [Rikenellaceae bacterium]
MKTILPYIKKLLAVVEDYHARPIRTTVDFEALSITVEQQTSERISASTLKRLWGYVNDKHEPRRYTLDVLSKYVGHKDFDTFCEWLSDQKLSDSDFFTAKKVVSSELTSGVRIEIGWSPDRYIVLDYLGGNRFRVESSENSKLNVGDEFSVATFMLGYPLYISTVMRDHKLLGSFVGGKSGGLTILSILENE